MKEIVEVGIPCTPAVKTDFQDLGERTELIVNSGGGMGGNRKTFVGKLKQGLDSLGFVTLKLTESGREIKVRPEWISYMEHVKFYKRTHIHNNNSSPSPRIDYFIARGETEIKFVNTFKHQELDHISMCDYVKKGVC